MKKYILLLCSVLCIGLLLWVLIENLTFVINNYGVLYSPFILDKFTKCSVTAATSLIAIAIIATSNIIIRKRASLEAKLNKLK